MIFETLTRNIKKLGLDVDKCIAFGFDGVAMMSGKRVWVAVQFKDQVNPFLNLVQCVAHATNLVALDATKAPNCKKLLKNIDNIINVVANTSRSLLNAKNASRFPLEINSPRKSLKRY